jgi:hypothetical protein
MFSFPKKRYLNPVFKEYISIYTKDYVRKITEYYKNKSFIRYIYDYESDYKDETIETLEDKLVATKVYKWNNFVFGLFGICSLGSLFYYLKK